MSSLPGYSLEDYLMWNFDLVVDGDTSANPSQAIAEAMGTSPEPRPRITGEQFAPIVAAYEPWRAYVQNRLSEFDEETQSWRDYAGYAFENLPDQLRDWSLAQLKQKL